MSLKSKTLGRKRKLSESADDNSIDLTAISSRQNLENIFTQLYHTDLAVRVKEKCLFTDESDLTTTTVQLQEIAAEIQATEDSLPSTSMSDGRRNPPRVMGMEKKLRGQRRLQELKQDLEMRLKDLDTTMERDEMKQLRFWGEDVVLTDLAHELLVEVVKQLGVLGLTHQQWRV